MVGLLELGGLPAPAGSRQISITMETERGWEDQGGARRGQWRREGVRFRVCGSEGTLRSGWSRGEEGKWCLTD